MGMVAIFQIQKITTTKLTINKIRHVFERKLRLIFINKKLTMSNFNYIEYLKNNPLLKGEKTQSTKLITEAQEDTIDSLQKAADDTSKMPADRDEARNKMYAMKKAKMKMSELKAKIREEILSTLSEEEELTSEEMMGDMEDMEDMPLDEAKEDEEEAPAEEEEMDAEVDVDVEVAPAQGLSAEEQEIQNSLKVAYDNAAAIGDQKLADQIGNSITFFTRTHIVER
jgi:hypothetical protein